MLSTSKSRSPSLIAHRGYSLLYPENTLLAFRKALELSPGEGRLAVHGLELDLHLSGDGKVVVIHDANTRRTGRFPFLKHKIFAPRRFIPNRLRRGPKKWIGQTSYAELARLDMGLWKGPQHAGEKIPLFDEVLSLAGKKTPIYAELKMPFGFDADLVKKTCAVIKRRGLESSVILHSFNPHLGAAVKRLAPKIKTGFLFERALHLKNLDFSVYDFLHPHWSVLTTAPEELLRAGKPLHVWTVVSKRTMRRLLLGKCRKLLRGLIVNDIRLQP